MASNSPITAFHAHLYFDPKEIEVARNFARAAAEEFDLEVGSLNSSPIGPHPRGSCQLSMSPETFGQFALWAMATRGEMTIFAHGVSGDDLDDHTRYALWFGQSEPLDLTIFD